VVGREEIMPVPEGIISTSEVWVQPAEDSTTLDEAIEIIKEEDAELLERLDDEGQEQE
jgi:hypothetical protein